jgi:selenocysteine lyase/cysteine desulfurase
MIPVKQQTMDTIKFEDLRKREFERLDSTDTVYLDYTGSALYPASLVAGDVHRLTNTVWGNPHSESSPSVASTEAIETARGLTLHFFDADPAEYDVVFTANASGAMRILSESFPFGSGSRLVLTADNHNSVNGLRVRAQQRGATCDYVPLAAELRAAEPGPWLTEAGSPSLFAFPAQSNFSGVQHPIDWVKQAQEKGYAVLLDAAAFAPTNPLSLSSVGADFVAVSFYKMFGYPTGVGALIARRDALAGLRRAYFGGGTVQFASVQNRIDRAKTGAEAFEDGTPNFLAMPAVAEGLRWLNELGTHRIKQHVTCLTASLLNRFSELGERMEVYGPRGTSARGATIVFNVRRNGKLMEYEKVEALARGRGIALRGGCFCNPGAAEHAFSIPADRANECLRDEFSIARFRSCIGGTPVGALRASIGIPTNEADLDRLQEFVLEIS